MNPTDLPDDGERLRRLLEESVAGVEPQDGLEAIRSRTKENAMPSTTSSSRPWLWGALGAAVATAAVIGGFAVLGDKDPVADDQGPAGSPSGTPSTQVTPDPSKSADDPTTAVTEPGDSRAAGIYYVGDSPRGPRLYREFHQVSADTMLLSALEQATKEPLDPDYRTSWPAGSFTGASFDGIGTDGQFSIQLADDSLTERPTGMSQDEAAIAVQQLIYTVQAAGQTRAPVQFYVGDEPADQVYGVPTAQPLRQGDVLDTLSLMNITTPEEGASASGTFEATGVNNGFEGTVACYIRDGQKDLWSGFTTTGWMEEKLFPWSLEVKTAGIPSGTYTFVCSNDDPTGGTEGNGPDTDTKTIVIS